MKNKDFRGSASLLLNNRKRFRSRQDRQTKPSDFFRRKIVLSDNDPFVYSTFQTGKSLNSPVKSF